MFFHICSVFIQLILIEEGHHLVQMGATEKIAVLMDVHVCVCMYICTCTPRARVVQPAQSRSSASTRSTLAGTNINFNIDDHFRLEMVVNIELQILYGS